LTKDAFGQMEHPGSRVAAAEAALDLVRRHTLEIGEGLIGPLDMHAAKSAEKWQQVEAALVECTGGSGSFRLFGGRSKSRQLRNLMDCLAQYARQRLSEEVLVAVKNCYAALAGKLADRQRDVGFCRQRLRHLMDNLDCNPADEVEDLAGTRPGSEHTLTRSPVATPDAFWDVIRQSATARVVLPDGEADLERAALHFLQNLKAENWLLLDKELSERVLSLFIRRKGANHQCQRQQKSC
jgi:hypothetical protein